MSSFGAQLLGSWSIAICAPLLGQLTNNSDNSFLTLIFFSSALLNSTTLLLNEIIAPFLVKSKISIYIVELFSLVLFSTIGLILITSFFPVHINSAPNDLKALNLLIWALPMACSLCISFLCAFQLNNIIKYCAHLTKQDLFIIGLIPALSIQIILCISLFIYSTLPLGFDYILYFIAMVFPASIQYIYLKAKFSENIVKQSLYHRKVFLFNTLRPRSLKKANIFKLFQALVLSVLIVLLSSLIAEKKLLVATELPGYLNLVFYALNMLSSLCNLVTKSLFLSSRPLSPLIKGLSLYFKRPSSPFKVVLSLISVICSVCIGHYLYHSDLFQLVVLAFIVQFLVARARVFLHYNYSSANSHFLK